MKKKKTTTPYIGMPYRIKHLLISRFTFVFLLFFYSAAYGFAQSKNIRGKIVDESNEPIIGAAVSAIGTSQGTISDINGNFSLKVNNDVKSIQISYIGYQSVKLNIEKQTTFNITLKETSNTLDEVTVIGYGVQKKATLTGAVSSVNSKEIQNTKNENFVNMMTGKIPGVRITQRSSEPGSFDSQFDIRGLGSPLVVVDGVPRDNYARIDPNEIESVSVLKDASAAIYGVRAANGVVLITTKHGSSTSGKFDITYSANFGFQQPIGFPKSTDAIQYMTLMNERSARLFVNYVNPTPKPYGETDFERYRDGTFQSSDWRNSVINEDLTPMQHHTLSLSGNGKDISYFLNLSYMKQDGITKTNYPQYNKWNFRANVEAKITHNLRTELKISGIMDEKKSPPLGMWDIIKQTWIALPNKPMYVNNDTNYPTAETTNALMLINPEIAGYRADNGRWFESSLALIYDIPFVKGLSLKAMYSYDYNDSDAKNYTKKYNLYKYNQATKDYEAYLMNSPSRISRSFGKGSVKNMQLSLNYEHSFAEKHNVKGLLVYEENGITGDNFNAGRNLSLDIDQLFAGDADQNQVAGMDKNGLFDIQRKSFIGRVNYDFESKYLFEVAFRYDGSSKFSKQKQWGFFPSVSAGWRISEEKFMKEFKPLSFVTNAKIRASYGEMGDDSALNYQFLTGYEYPEKGSVMGGAFVNGLGFTGLANKRLTWYTARTYNIGLDLDIWNGLLNFQYDYFVRNRSGLFGDRLASLPGTFGARLPQENLNKDKTLGYEIVVSHRNKINDFQYSISGNFSLTRSKTIYEERSKAGNSYENWRNNPINRYKNIWWGLTYDGQFTSYDQIYNSTVDNGGGNQSKVPGDYYYKDLNGDGVINQLDEKPIATHDMPYINYGINMSVNYKRFDLSALFQGTAMSYTKYYEALDEPLVLGGGNTLTYFMDRWHPADPNDDIFDPHTKWVSGNFPTTGSGSSWGQGTRGMKNASYLRLKSVELGYTFSHKWISALGLQDARVYANAYNLFTITKLKYIDPEHPGGGMSNDPAQDLYGYMYPLTRTFNVGFSLTF